MNNKRITIDFVVDYFKSRTRDDLTMSTMAMKTEVKNLLKCNMTKSKCKRAKKLIVDGIFGNYKDEFQWLQAYYDELHRRNPS